MSKYLAVLVPAAGRAAAAAVINTVWPSEHPENNIGVPILDASDADWFGGNMLVSAEEAEALEALQGVEGIHTYLYGQEDKLLDAAYPSGPELGSAWGWAESLAVPGLHLPPVDL